MCASYEVDVFMCFDLCHAIFTGVYAMYFCDQCGDYHKHAKYLSWYCRFQELRISVFALLLFLCHVFMLLQRDPCFFWVCSVRMILKYAYAISIHAHVYIYGVPYATVRSMPLLSTFSKDVLDIWSCSIHPCICLHLWSALACLNLALLLPWQIVYMLINFAKVVVVDPCMLWTCSCFG